MAKQLSKKKTPAKKVAVKKSSFPKPDVNTLLQVFHDIKSIMKDYESKFNVRINIEGKYDLWVEKDLQAFGREYDSMMFAALIIQTGYVGFYFMPVYCQPEMKNELHPDLAKLLKGKSCFHVKTLDADMKKHIKKSLDLGVKLYKKLGWL